MTLIMSTKILVFFLTYIVLYIILFLESKMLKMSELTISHLPPELSTKGRYVTCRYCGKKFKFKTKLEKEHWHIKRKRCIYCNVTYCSLPKTEKILMDLQDKFLRKRDENYITEMYHILLAYAESLFKKRFSSIMLKNVGLSNYYLENAVSLLIEEYYAKKDFKIHSSFGGYLRFKLQQAITGKAEFDKRDINNISLDYQLQDGNFIEYEDNQKYNINYFENDHYIESIITQLEMLIDGTSEYCKCAQEKYILLNAIFIHLYDGERKVDNFFKILQNDEKIRKKGKYLYIKTMDLLKTFLKSLHVQNSSSI